MPVTQLGIGAYVSTSGGGRGRIVDRLVKTDTAKGTVTLWWLVKLTTDKGALLWFRADQLTMMN